MTQPNPRTWWQLLPLLCEANRQGFKFQLGGIILVPEGFPHHLEEMTPWINLCWVNIGCEIEDEWGDAIWASDLPTALKGWPLFEYDPSTPWDLGVPPGWVLRKRGIGPKSTPDPWDSFF